MIFLILFVCAKHDYGVDCYYCEIQTRVNALCSHRRDIFLCMISRYDITVQVLEHFLECTGIAVLEWPGNSPDMNPIENIWNIMKKRLETKCCVKQKIFGSDNASMI